MFDRLMYFLRVTNDEFYIQMNDQFKISSQ